MSSRQMLPGRGFWLLGTTLILLAGLGAPTGCSSTAGQRSIVPDGGSAGAGATGGSAGGAATGDSSGAAATGGSSGAAATGGSSGAAATGGSSSGGGPAGGAGAGAGGAGGANGAAGQSGSRSCTNAPHVLPLNPANPQDGITLGNFYVDTDTWNAASYPVSQTMYVCDYNSWYVVAKMDDASGDGAVKTYPDVHEDFGSAPALSSFSAISSSFAHAGPHVGVYEFAYDIWLNGVASSGSTEVMIWTDNYNQVPSGSIQETVNFDGQSYQVYKNGSYIAFVETTNITSGTVNLLEFFNHIISKGWIPSTSTLGAIDYGVELVSTNGMDATFAVNDFSLTTN